RGSFDLNAIRIFPVAPQQFPSGIGVVALRVTNRQMLTNSGPINELITSNFRLRVGDALALDAVRARAVLTRGSQYFASAACFAIIGVVAMMLLVLYLYDRSRREFLLLSITCLSLTALRLNELATAAYVPYPIAVCLFIVFLGNVPLTATQYLFYFALAGRKPGRLVKTAVVVTCLGYTPNAIDVIANSSATLWVGHLNVVLMRPMSLCLHCALSCTAFVVFLPWRRTPRRVRPLAILCMLWATADLLWFLAEMTAIPIPGVPNVFATWGVPLLEVRAFTTAGVITSLLGLLFRDQRRTTIEHAALAAELEAARVVQQVLIPEEIPHVPGFSIESVYKPASQVGGDFFQIAATQNDGALIVIGDVSGKGMPAAMTVSLLVGTFRTLAHYTESPGEILMAMNQRMLARSGGGFTTCLVMRVDPDGTLTAANAGHLAPYLNGKELALENGLPLGLAAESHYAESTFTLEGSARLTLLTDGVVEARDASGELFGFERAAAISMQSSEEIARAAQHFGQEDDITVLTVTFAPVEVLHA
ncbi:MAG TPA: PP2C family protein-serine/threonine phosphatase, partial [Terracidiphilus sp.]|nr:PP2C family protein-serine/threonine phosphatase [Terracidiphilus sp.]